MDEEPQHRRIEDSRRILEMSTVSLWIRYLSLSGSESLAEIEAYLRGEFEFTTFQANVLTLAINEAIMERGGDHRLAFRYADSE